MIIQLVDVSARDGLQGEANAAQLSAQAKADYIQKLAKTGIKRIEAGSFVKASAVPAMANSLEVALELNQRREHFPGVIFSYLVPNLKGLERAKEIGAEEVAIFLAVSEQFSKANINQTVDDAFAAIASTITEALKSGIRVRGYLSTVFGYDDLPFAPKEVARRSKQLLDMGCFEVSLGDTTAIGTPNKVEAVINALVGEGIALETVAMHFHDTFGRAIANVDRSYDLGIRIFDASTGGIGGCPYANSPKGNLAMEDLVAWCEKRSLACDVTDVEALAEAGRFIRNLLGKSG